MAASCLIGDLNIEYVLYVDTNNFCRFYNDGRSESDVLAAIRATYESGAVIGGASAGAACMPTAVMVAGGSSYDVSAHHVSVVTGVISIPYSVCGVGWGVSK